MLMAQLVSVQPLNALKKLFWLHNLNAREQWAAVCHDYDTATWTNIYDHTHWSGLRRFGCSSTHAHWFYVGVAERAWPSGVHAECIVRAHSSFVIYSFSFIVLVSVEWAGLFLDRWISNIEWVQRPGEVGWQVALSLTETGKSVWESLR